MIAMPIPLEIHLTVFAVSVVAGIVLSYTKDARTLAELARRFLISTAAVFVTAAVGADLLIILNEGLIFIGFDLNDPATWTETTIIVLAIFLSAAPFFLAHWLQSVVRSDNLMSNGIDLDRIRALKSDDGAVS